VGTAGADGRGGEHLRCSWSTGAGCSRSGLKRIATGPGEGAVGGVARLLDGAGTSPRRRERRPPDRRATRGRIV